MIQTSRQVFELLCAKRGRALAAAMPCVMAQNGDRWTVDETHLAFPAPAPGLGDRVASALAAVGITEERVSKALGRPCGCGKRKKLLNECGRRLGIGGKVE